MAEKVKKDTLFQESLRRLLHISSNLPWTEVCRHLLEWSQTMKISGYSAKERFETIRGAHMRYKEMRRKVEEGEIQSLNREKKVLKKMKDEKGGLTAGS